MFPPPHTDTRISAELANPAAPRRCSSFRGLIMVILGERIATNGTLWSEPDHLARRKSILSLRP